MSRRSLVLAFLAISGLGGGLARSARQAEPIIWLDDEHQAFRESTRSGKPVLVEAWAEWCTACKLMDRNTWSDPTVQREVRKHFVPLRLDLTEETSASIARREAYRVEGLPTVLSCRSPGCAAPRVTGYLRPAEVLAFLASRG
ncbi:MAG TPA: thioredoxin family protein [Myxococcaceae bacterium]|nr:thioredoxin family protein [Myxococcaceae bacterium]